jgi:hypothetical protein
MELAKDTPEIVAKHLTDRRPTFVRNLLVIDSMEQCTARGQRGKNLAISQSADQA